MATFESKGEPMTDLQAFLILYDVMGIKLQPQHITTCDAKDCHILVVIESYGTDKTTASKLTKGLQLHVMFTEEGKFIGQVFMEDND